MKPNLSYGEFCETDEEAVENIIGPILSAYEQTVKDYQIFLRDGYEDGSIPYPDGESPFHEDDEADLLALCGVAQAVNHALPALIDRMIRDWLSLTITSGMHGLNASGLDRLDKEEGDTIRQYAMTILRKMVDNAIRDGQSDVPLASM